jgi:hypothetical protein
MNDRIEQVSKLVAEQKEGSAPFNSQWLIFEAGDCVGHPVWLEWSPVYPHQDAVLWCGKCEMPLAITNPQD